MTTIVAPLLRCPRCGRGTRAIHEVRLSTGGVVVGCMACAERAIKAAAEWRTHGRALRAW